MNPLFRTLVLFIFILLTSACGNKQVDSSKPSAVVNVETTSNLSAKQLDKEMAIDPTMVADNESDLEPIEHSKLANADMVANRIEVEKKEINTSKKGMSIEEMKKIKEQHKKPKPKATKTYDVNTEVKKVETKEKKEVLSEIAFRRNFYNYGEVNQGEIVEHEYEFTNIGEAPLVIKDVVVSCGCTQPSYPFVAIAPGEKGYIGVKFDSKTKEGDQKSIITVTANTEPAVWKLYLDGNVVVPDSTKVD